MKPMEHSEKHAKNLEGQNIFTASVREEIDRPEYAEETIELMDEMCLYKDTHIKKEEMARITIKFKRLSGGELRRVISELTKYNSYKHRSQSDISGVYLSGVKPYEHTTLELNYSGSLSDIKLEGLRFATPQVWHGEPPFQMYREELEVFIPTGGGG